MPTTIFVGDCKETLSHLPDQSVHTCVTSPPYFGLRDYGMDEQIGLEETPEAFVAELVSVFREVRRVLRNDSTLWLNLGDRYGKGKQLLGIPWRVAFALQADGWILRSDIIWQKPNAMPSSVTTRPTTDHEYIFLFSKSKEYYYDADSIREPHVTFSDESKMKGGRGHFGRRGGTPEAGKNGGNTNLHNARWDQAFHPKGRNKRTVWKVSLSKYRGAHFAVFPPDLIEPCILAGCPVGGIVLDPFGGSGTTGMVANQHGRDAWLCELNPEYAQLALERVGPGASLS